MTALKYFLYFHFYLLAGTESNITTIVAISQDSLMFYVYDHGYVRWKIEERIAETYRKITHVNGLSSGVYFSGKYYASCCEGLKALVYVTDHDTDIYITDEELSYHIYLKRKK